MKSSIPSDVAEQAPAAGAELTQATEELTVMLLEVEEVFIDWKLGVSAAVDLGCEDHGGHPLRLRFRKYNVSWGLFVETDAVKKGATPVPITTASRAIRLRALERIPALSRALLDETRRQIAEVRTATEKVRQFIATIQK